MPVEPFYRYRDDIPVPLYAWWDEDVAKREGIRANTSLLGPDEPPDRIFIDIVHRYGNPRKIIGYVIRKEGNPCYEENYYLTPSGGSSDLSLRRRGV